MKPDSIEGEKHYDSRGPRAQGRHARAAVAVLPSWPPVTESTVRAVNEALREGVWSDVAGTRKLAFEQAFADAHDSRHALAVSNGTVSLQIALAALDVGSSNT